MQKFLNETLESEAKGQYEKLRAVDVEKAFKIFDKSKSGVIDKEELKSFIMEVSGVNQKAQDKLQFRQQRHDKIEKLIKEREAERKGSKERQKFMGFPLAGPEDDISELLSRDLLQQHSGNNYSSRAKR